MPIVAVSTARFNRPGTTVVPETALGIGFCNDAHTTPTPASGFTVTINPGDNVASIVNGLTSGQSAYFNAGTHRVAAALTPATNVTLKGPVDGSAILDGSVQKASASFTSDGSGRWYISHTFQGRDSIMRDGSFSVCELTSLAGTGATGGSGASAFNSCWDRDQAWWDGARMTPVVTLAAGDIAPGNRFYIDRTNSRLYVWNNPVGHTVEIDSTPYLFNNASSSGVTVDGLTIRRFASPAQRGAASVTGNNWTFKNATFRDNHAHGLYGANVSGWTVDNCQFLYNGQLGMGLGTTSSGTTFSNNLIKNSLFQGNNAEDFYIGDWEAGGFKSTAVSGGAVIGCQFIDNKGLDLWVDFGARWVFDGNYSDGAYGQAIRIEVGTNCIVRNNIITGSGTDIGDHYRASHSNWNTPMDSCAISISEAQYVECYGNQILGKNLNGIVVNIRGRQDTQHVYVHDNFVDMQQAPVRTGTSTNTTGTMIAAGMLMSGAPNAASTYFGVAEAWSMPSVGSYSGSGLTTTYRNEVSGNTYIVSDLSTTPRFVWLNDAGTGTTYRTGATYTTKNPTDATAITVPTRPGFRVGASGDDGYWSVQGAGAFSSTSTGPTLGDFDASIWGRCIFLRIAGFNVPQGATIDTAYLEFLPKGINGTIPPMKLWAEAADNPAAPTSKTDAEGRSLTSSSVSWTPASWDTATWQQSPSLVSVIQEVVNRPGWAIGNALHLLWKPNPVNGSFSVQQYVSINNYDTTPVKTNAPGVVVTYH